MGLGGERGEELCVLGLFQGDPASNRRFPIFNCQVRAGCIAQVPVTNQVPIAQSFCILWQKCLQMLHCQESFWSLCCACVWVISPPPMVTCTLFSRGADLPQTSQREATHWGSHLSCRLAGRLVWRLNKRSPEAPGSYHQPSAVCREHPVSELLLHRSQNTGEAKKVNTGHHSDHHLILG